MKHHADTHTMDLFSGRDIGHAMAQMAADHAGDEWKKDAYRALDLFARTYPQFTIEEVRSDFPEIEAPTDKAWGSVVIRARKDGLISPAGAVKVAKGRMVATLWRSNVYGGM